MPLKLRTVNETRKRRKHPRAYAKGCFFTYHLMSELLIWYISIWGIIKASSYLSLYLKKFYIVLQLDF